MPTIFAHHNIDIQIVLLHSLFPINTILFVFFFHSFLVTVRCSTSPLGVYNRIVQTKRNEKFI